MKYANIKMKIKLQPDIICVMYVGVVSGGVCVYADQGKTARVKIESPDLYNVKKYSQNLAD